MTLQELLSNALLRYRQVVADELRFFRFDFFQLLIGLVFFTDGVGLFLKLLAQRSSQNSGSLEIFDSQLALFEGERFGIAFPLVGIEEDFSEVSR